MEVAVLGTGTMGFPIARNIAARGMRVRAWNRTRERAQSLAEHGVSVASAPAEAVAGADVVITMMSDGEAVLNVMDGEHRALEAAGEDAIWLQMSTIGIEPTDRCMELARQRGVRFVDAPVLGTKQPAEEGKLTVLAAGDEDALERCAPIFDAIAQRTVRVGEPGRATRLKLVANAWIVSLVESLAETLALGEALGIEPTLFLETIKGGPLDLPYAQLKGSAMAKREFPAAFSLRLAHKDAVLVHEAASAAGLDLPLLEAVRERFAEAIALGHGDEDLAAVYLASAPSAPART